MNTKSNHLIVFNPAARGERARALREALQTLSPQAVIRSTSFPGDARELAREGVRQGFDSIIAAGGDGTINEVVNGIAGADVRFGILPVGTMNVFASELGIPQNDLSRAWEVIAAGHVREVDLPTTGRGYFVQLGGVGLDAEVVRQTTPDSKKALGPMSYLLTLAQVAAASPPVIEVIPAHGPVRRGSFVLVGNGRLYGGPFVLFKDARLDDGLLDVLVFQHQSHWDLLRYVQAIAFGDHSSLPDVEYFQTPSLRLSSDQDVPVELDGEMCGTLPIEFGFASAKLRVFAPSSNAGAGGESS